MDNFRRHKRYPNRKHATDGFIKPPAGRSRTRDGMTQRSFQPGLQGRVSEFKTTTDGIRPAARPQSFGLPGNEIRRNPQSLGQVPIRQVGPQQQINTQPNPMYRTQLQPQTSQFERMTFDAPKRRRSFHPIEFLFGGKKRAIGTVFVMFIIMGGVFGGRLWLMLGNMFEGGGSAAVLQEEVDPATLRGEGDGRVNILLVGRDEEGTGLTDTILIASINPIQKEAAILSIPRDLYVQTNNGSYSKINAVFPNTVNQYEYNAEPGQPNVKRNAEEAGIKALQEIVQSRIGLPVHYYGMIDLRGFVKAINTVGGVDAEIPKELAVQEHMRFNGKNYFLNVGSGSQHFDGLRAIHRIRLGVYLLLRSDLPNWNLSKRLRIAADFISRQPEALRPCSRPDTVSGGLEFTNPALQARLKASLSHAVTGP